MTRIGKATMLKNAALPMLEVNAAYSASALQQPIQVRVGDLTPSQLEGDELAGRLVALEVLPTLSTSSVWVEQVAWTQAPQLARVWCDANNASDWQALVARELSHALETHSDLLAYLAYVGDVAAGMMIISSDGICGLWAGAIDVAQALFARGARDFSKLEVTVALERRHGFEALETARFEILVTGSSDRQLLEASP